MLMAARPMVMTARWICPVRVCMFWLRARSRSTGLGEGEPFLARRRPSTWAAALALRVWPSEMVLMSTLARPLMPASGAMTPLSARSMGGRVAGALSGVPAWLCWLGGVALPAAGRAPSLGRWAWGVVVG